MISAICAERQRKTKNLDPASLGSLKYLFRTILVSCGKRSGSEPLIAKNLIEIDTFASAFSVPRISAHAPCPSSPSYPRMSRICPFRPKPTRPRKPPARPDPMCGALFPPRAGRTIDGPDRLIPASRQHCRLVHVGPERLKLCLVTVYLGPDVPHCRHGSSEDR
jgi:hypothetical protein